MKTIKRVACAGGFCALFVLGLTSCDTSFENPNAASEDQVVGSVDGLQALAIGMRRQYSVVNYSSIVRSSALSAREYAVTAGFTNPQELEAGGVALPVENGTIRGLWSESFRVMDMAEKIIANVGVVEEDATRASYLATGHLFKAIALGSLAQFYEALPVSVDPDGDGDFRSRTEALEEAVRLLEDAAAVLGSSSAVPSDFRSVVLGSASFDLYATVNAYLARYNLFLGNHNEAIAAADEALGATTGSVWSYDGSNSNENPLWIASNVTFDIITYRPIDNFGIDPAEFVVDPADGRIDFYLEELDLAGENSGLPVETLLGFGDVVDEAIPAYLPGEMHATKAEAYARLGQTSNAVGALNDLVTKTDDPFGVNAGLPAFQASDFANVDDLLLAIYRHRRIEMFLTGVSLEDHRRFFPGYVPPDEGDFDSYDRNRNFYPYPPEETANNPKTPGNPRI